MTDVATRTLTLPVDAQHPAFAGHFPGAPIVPGVLLLDWALAAIEEAEKISVLPGELSVVKFLQPVVPAADLSLTYLSLTFSIAESGAGSSRKIIFRIACDEQIVASATLTTSSSLISSDSAQ